MRSRKQINRRGQYERNDGKHLWAVHLKVARQLGYADTQVQLETPGSHLICCADPAIYMCVCTNIAACLEFRRSCPAKIPQTNKDSFFGGGTNLFFAFMSHASFHHFHPQKSLSQYDLPLGLLNHVKPYLDGLWAY